MQSDEKVALTQMHKKSVERSGSTDSDLAPRGDSEETRLSMSPILTAYTTIHFHSLSKGLTIKGW
jgi:hypothetical protein